MLSYASGQALALLLLRIPAVVLTTSYLSWVTHGSNLNYPAYQTVLLAVDNFIPPRATPLINAGPALIIFPSDVLRPPPPFLPGPHRLAAADHRPDGGGVSKTHWSVGLRWRYRVRPRGRGFRRAGWRATWSCSGRPRETSLAGGEVGGD